jgi:arginine decarboxylase
MERWGINDSAKIYNLDNWGSDLFSINKKGNVCVHPSPTSKYSIDLRDLVDDLIKRKIKPPILLRFMDILEGRIAAINRAFRSAISENDYPAKYRTFYPIKVNQQRQVVEAITHFGKRYNIGLEVGSKAELVVAISFATGNNIPIICNGYKDTEFIETVLYASKIGYDITIVVEKLFELEKIIALSKKTGIVPKLGIRVKLSSKGIGKWSTSGGEDAKFGLRISELMTAIDLLEEVGMKDHLKLLHFHIGSQITKIDKIKNALIEGTRIYAEMRKMGVNLEFVDIGGGLGVDYDGSKSSYFSSVNYTVEEYANDVIYQVKNICDEAGVDCPNIISESGRAIVAHYSVLVTNALNTNTQSLTPDFEEVLDSTETLSPTVKKLVDIYKSIDRHSLREDYHDTLQLIQEAVSLFNLGYLNLQDRAVAEWLCSKIFRKINGIVEKIKPIPEELQNFQLSLRQTYFANFSLGHRPALPDHADPATQPAPRRHGVHCGHHLRLGRRDHQFCGRERPDQVSPPAQGAQGRRLLHRILSDRRLSGDTGRHAQPVRRHQRRPHHLQQKDQLQDRHGHYRRRHLGKPQVRAVQRARDTQTCP